MRFLFHISVQAQNFPRTVYKVHSFAEALIIACPITNWPATLSQPPKICLDKIKDEWKFLPLSHTCYIPEDVVKKLLESVNDKCVCKP